MKTLITGFSGFIGSNLAERCINEGWEVDGVDDLSNGHREFVPNGMRNQFYCDFADKNILAYIKEKSYDVVFHLAAVPRVSYSVEHPVETFDVNVSKTLKLMDVCRGSIKRFVFASSSSVYGGADELPTPETHPKDPKSPYALQKSEIEEWLKLYCVQYGMDSVCLRFFNVFGKHAVAGVSPYATALSAWMSAIKLNKPMRSDGDGSQTRDLCYVDNVTDACVKAAAVQRTLRSVRLNVACAERTSNNEILQYLLKRYPKTTVVHAPWRAGDVMHTHADINETTRVINYRPTVKVWEGVERTCDWYDSNWHWIKDLKQGV